jgi:hypothetical protein
LQPPDERLEDPKWKIEFRRIDGAPRSFPLLLPKQPTEQLRFQLSNRLLRLSHGYRDLAMLCLQERSGCKDCCAASGPQFLEIDLAQWLNSLPIKYNLEASHPDHGRLSFGTAYHLIQQARSKESRLAFVDGDPDSILT